MTGLCDTCTLRNSGCFIDPIGPVHHCTVYNPKGNDVPNPSTESETHIDPISREPVPEIRSSTDTLISALRVLARDIQSGDGVANAAIAEAADRLDELQKRVAHLEHMLHGRPGKL